MNDNVKMKIRNYLLLTFLITWGCWGTIAIANQFGALSYGLPLTMIIFLIGGNAPPIASYFLLKRWGEIDGVKMYMKRFFNTKSSVKYYMIIVLILCVHFGIAAITGSTHRELPLYYGLLMYPMNFIGGALEEIGWRGILQPNMEEIMPNVWATVSVALIWWVWHLPLWFIVGTYQVGISFFYFGISVLGFSFLYAAVRMVTKNVFMCILLHGLVNSFSGIFLLDQNVSTIATTLVEIAIALILVSVVNSSKTRKLDLSIHEGELIG
jgi:membrane protease YdiL (CAAX protease family)